MNQPIAPAIPATIVPACRALTMKGNSVSASKSLTGFQERAANSAMIVAVVVVGWRLGGAHDGESPVRGLKHLDRRPVEAAQSRAVDHLSRRALHAAAPGEVD